MESITIRPATASDADFIRLHYHEVEENGAPTWRSDDNNPYTDRWIDDVIANNPPDQEILIAADSHGAPLGYCWVLSLLDFDTIIPRGHIAGVAVSESTRGQGIGELLVTAAETWCRNLNLPEVSLHCYVENEGAHRLYARLGYQDEWIRMRKGLNQRSG